MLLFLLRLGNRVACLIDEALCSHDLEGVVNRVKVRPRCPVRVEVIVAPGEVLSVVHGEVHVVQRVVSRAVDKFLRPVAGDHVTIVNEDGPDLHSDEEHHVKVPVHRAKVDEGAGHVLVHHD